MNAHYLKRFSLVEVIENAGWFQELLRALFYRSHSQQDVANPIVARVRSLSSQNACLLMERHPRSDTPKRRSLVSQERTGRRFYLLGHVSHHRSCSSSSIRRIRFRFPVAAGRTVLLWSCEAHLKISHLQK